jgi:hypothetical protein
MNEQTAKLLEDLAAKLQVSSAHLWEVLVTQAYIYSVTQLVVFFALSIAAYNCCKYLQKKYKSLDDASDGAWVILLVVILMYVAYVCYFLLSLDSIIAGLVNPEYMAIKTVLSGLKQ